MGAKMKKITIILFNVLLLCVTTLNLYCQVDITNVFTSFLPKQIDSYQDKLLFLGYDWNNSGILSIYMKSVNESNFTNITENINLNLDVHQKVHFDNFGNIWAFGKNNLWKYENGKWNDVPTPPDLLPKRQFRDFCFDNENNLFVSVRIGFERSRETINGTVYVVYDSVNNELLKINTNTPTVSFEVVKKFYDKLEHFYDAIHTITRRPDGAIVCILAEKENNLMIYKNDELSFSSIPVNPDGLSAEVTSMKYDNQMNLWYSVKAAGQFYDESPYNGVHKFTTSGLHIRWDSSDGLRGKLFQEFRNEPTLSVHDIAINQNTGLIWGVTSFGFFSIDESKPKSNQLTFYGRDSLVNQKFRFFPTNASVSGNEFLFESITQHNQNTYLVSQLGYLEIIDKNPPSNVENFNTSNNISINVFPIPSSNTEVFITIQSKEFVNGSTLRIMDMSGRTVQLMQIESSSSGNIQIPIDAKEMTSGTYYAVFQNGRNKLSKQFVITK